MSTNCPKCHMENPAESKSCVHCGLLLDAVDKIPTFHPEIKETPTESQPGEDSKSTELISEEVDTRTAVLTDEEPQEELTESKSLFSGLKSIFRKKKI